MFLLLTSSTLFKEYWGLQDATLFASFLCSSKTILFLLLSYSKMESRTESYTIYMISLSLSLSLSIPLWDFSLNFTHPKLHTVVLATLIKLLKILDQILLIWRKFVVLCLMIKKRRSTMHSLLHHTVDGSSSSFQLICKFRCMSSRMMQHTRFLPEPSTHSLM